MKKGRGCNGTIAHDWDESDKRKKDLIFRSLMNRYYLKMKMHLNNE